MITVTLTVTLTVTSPPLPVSPPSHSQSGVDKLWSAMLSSLEETSRSSDCSPQGVMMDYITAVVAMAQILVSRQSDQSRDQQSLIDRLSDLSHHWDEKR